VTRTAWWPAACALLAIASCRSAPADPVQAPGRQPGVDVEAVRVRLRLDPDALDVRARAMLRVRHPRRLDTLRLGLDDALAVSAVRVDGRPVVAGRVGDALLVPLGPGTRASSVEVAYGGRPSAGLYAAEAAGQRVVFTDGWPDRTAGWLPAVHHPSDPFALDLTVVVPAAYDVVASGEVRLDTVAGALRTVRTVLPAGAPSYTAAFAVGRYTTVRDTSGAVPIAHALLDADAGRAGGLRRVPAALDTLARLLGPYPYASFTTVEVPLAFAGMENAAAPFLQATLYRETAESGPPVEEVAVHELVHQWWGNRVVPADWRELWLAEGPATYLTADLLGRLDGPDTGLRHLARFVRNTEAADARRRLVPERLGRPEDALSLTVYNKGAAVLHLLRLTVGERAFWRALRDVQTTHADRPLTTGAFGAAFERASGRDLGALFAYWAYGTEIPRLETDWDRRTRTLTWTLSRDGGTLRGVPVRLLIRQDEAERVVRLAAGRAVMPGTSTPDVWPVGVLLDIDPKR
jgi:aminopeptidase N